MVYEPERTSASLDESSQGIDLFFQAALQYGYRYVFGNPGTTEAVFMDGLVRYPDLQFVLCLHENVATGAADGLARLSGWPALVNLHLAPGLSNGLANIHNAKRARVPMIVTVGEHDVRHLLEDSPLAGDIAGIARGVCKWTWTVRDASELADVLQRATIIAMTPPQGPVCLILPTNVLTAPPRKADGHVPAIPALQMPERGPASSKDIARATEVLLNARNPMLLVGDIGTEAVTQVGALAALTGARIVYDTFPRLRTGRALPGSSYLPYLPDQRRAFLEQADVLFLIGVGGFTTLFMYEYDPAPVVATHTRVIQLDDDIEAVGKNERGSQLLYGDVTASLALLVAQVQEHVNSSGEKSARATRMAETTHRRSESITGETENSVLLPKTLMRALHQILPADTILVDESITSRTALQNELLDDVETYLASRGGALGAALPLAVGAQLGARDRFVAAVVGDGSAMYSIQTLWTATHYHLPILTVICNNASYDIIKLEMLRLRGTLATSGRAHLGAVTGIGQPRLNFAELAQGMGMQGWTVREVADLMPALKAALETCQRGEPALVDVHVPAMPV